MLGVERCRQEGLEAGRVMLSTASFWKQRVFAREGPLLIPCARSRRLEVVFRSPMTTVRSRAAIMGSPFPTCLFNTLLNLPQVRLACGSSLIRFAPASAISPPPARYLIPVRQSRVRLGSPLPLRGFLSPPDLCVRSDLLPGSSPSKTARSPVLSALGTPAAEPRSRSATASEAGCSSNLLEPVLFSTRSKIKSIGF
jgi:hypothetical protein